MDETEIRARIRDSGLSCTEKSESRRTVTAEPEAVKKRIGDIETYISAFMEIDRDKLIGILSLKNPL